MLAAVHMQRPVVSPDVRGPSIIPVMEKIVFVFPSVNNSGENVLKVEVGGLSLSLQHRVRGQRSVSADAMWCFTFFKQANVFEAGEVDKPTGAMQRARKQVESCSCPWSRFI